MENCKYHLDGGQPCFCLDARRNPPAVVSDRYRAVRVQVYLNQGAVACQSFIHGIVHDFIYHVVKPL